MNRKKTILLWAFAFAAVLATYSYEFVQAQPADQPAGGDRAAQRDRGDRGGDRGGDWQQRMEEFRKRMNEETRKQMGFSEEEWKVIEPKLKAVTDAQMELRMAGMGMGMGRGGFGGRGMRGGDRRGGDPNAAQPAASTETQTPMAKASQELGKVLQDTNSSADAVKAALETYRAEKAKLTKKLEDARKALKELVNVRQEAFLVSRGILE